MAYALHLTENENIVLSQAAVERLLRRGDGDTALLYLFLLKNNNSATPERICRELGWERPRLARAEEALKELRLVLDAGDSVPELPEQPAQSGEYTREDVSQTLETDPRFAMLTEEVEKKLGKKLNSRDLQILLGLYDELGLPAEVIYELLNHCLERAERNYGKGRKPTMRQIEKEGYAWARRGLFTAEATARYLKEYDSTQGKIPAMMAALGLGQRRPVPSEEKYLLDWISWGFDPETVALAYDKTVLRCRELKWPYLNGILRRWHQQGISGPEEAARAEKREAPAKENGSEEIRRMRKYVQSLHEKD